MERLIRAMTSKSTPTLHDVAIKAGVSTATVSRALNFPDLVAKATHEKVATAISALGYSPNFGARAMAARRTNTIGAIIPTMENAIFARGLQAFQDELRNQGYTLLVASTNYKPEQEEDQIRTLIARGADGLMLIGHQRDARINQFLATQAVATVVTWAYDPQMPLPSIGFDNRAAMGGLARAALTLGHRRLAMISAMTDTNDRARARVEGVKDAMTEAGLDPAQLTVIETPYGIENGADAFDRIMALSPRPSLVLCGNDVLAVGAMRRAQEMDIKVPEQVSITGFDDIELAQVALPALTTVGVPHLEMGRQAARFLIEMLQSGATPASLELKAEVKLRASLAPPHDLA